MHNTPLLTIITIARNAEGTISDTLLSVKAVSERLLDADFKLEYLCIVSPSDDSTWTLINDFQSNNAFCELINFQPLGVYKAMNEGLRRSSGLFTHLLNADDVIYNPDEYLNSILKLHRCNRSVLVSSIVYFSRPSNRIVYSWLVSNYSNKIEFIKKLKRGLHFPHPGFIVKTDIYQQFMFDERLSCAADYKCMHQVLLLAAHNDSIIFQEKPSVAMDISGITGSLAGILKGKAEIQSINTELNIAPNIFGRYFQKFFSRYILSIFDSRSYQQIIPSKDKH